MAGTRAILHVDMDAFFASVEQRDDPALRGLPVLVGGTGPRGVVAAASYEARRHGCHSALPMSVARRRCPEAVVVRPRGHAYREASERVFQIFHTVTPLVEPLSIDEAFLDVTASARAIGTGQQIAQGIRSRILAELGLTASVGVAPNKFLSKVASELGKPDGLTEIAPQSVEQVLGPLPLRHVPGIGPSGERRLAKLGLRTIGDLRQAGREALVRQVGATGDRLFDLACGRDPRLVIPDGEAKSLSQECTFEEDLEDAEIVRCVLTAQVESVARRLRGHGLSARRAGLKIRFGAFHTIARTRTLSEPTDETSRLIDAASQLWRTWASREFQPVRLIGFGVSSLRRRSKSADLFASPDRERRQRLDRVVDQLQDRFGDRSLRRAAGALARRGRADGLPQGDGPERRDRGAGGCSSPPSED